MPPTKRPLPGAAGDAPAPVRRLGRPPRVKAEDTRSRLLAIARAVYAERGYDSATNKEIADLAGMTTAALYYHFTSKRDLYLAVHDDTRARVYGRFESVLDPGDAFADQLLTVLRETHRLNEEDPTLARFLAAARTDMARCPELVDALRARVDDRRDFFERIVDVGVASGEIPPANRPLVSAFILAMLAGMTDALSDDQLVHGAAIDAVEAILAGDLVRVRPAGRARRVG